MRANKTLGQHFLFDPGILDRCALAAGPVQGRTVIEVGPGPGGLTAALLRHGAASVTAVEMDPRFASALRDWPEYKEGRLRVIEGDAVTLDLEEQIKDRSVTGPAMIIANLPYNVGSPLIVKWLMAGSWRGEMALMFQHEVALRLTAKPGDTHYGRLAVLASAVCHASIELTLPPGAFRPPPKVESSVVVFHPLPESQRFKYLESLVQITAAAFGQRRKMLRASLKSLPFPKTFSVSDFLEGQEIDPTRRAETLTQDEFRLIAKAWQEIQST